MLIPVHPDNPNQRNILSVVECLKNGGIVIFPTDTVYGLGCDIYKPKAVERIASIKGIRVEKANFSLICYDLSHITDFTKPLSNHIYRVMKKALPGPFTFILDANNNVPKLFQSKKKTVGIRVPENNVIREIVRELGNPVMTTSIRDEDKIIEYTTDPELIHEKFEKLVDMVVDGGYGDNEGSTVVDCTGDEIKLIRQGKGILEEFL